MELKADLSQLDTAVDYVRDTLSRKKVDSREAIRAALITEEAFRVMTECAESPDEVISISIVSRLGNAQIRISGRTKEFAEDRIDISSQWSFDDLTPEQEDICRSLNKRILGDRLSVRFRRGISVIKIGVSGSQFAQMYLTFAGLLLGVLAGILMGEILAPSVNTAVSNYFFDPVSTMFMNALKMIVAPLVFFSIASSIGDIQDMRTLGRIAGRIVAYLVGSAVVGIVLGFCIWHVFPIGDPQLREMVSESAVASAAQSGGYSISLLDAVVGIVPSDVISPFLRSDMLKIIFMAILLGVACGTLSDRIRVLKDFLADGYIIAERITQIIIQVMPLAIFCSMAKMVLSMDVKTLLAVFSWVPVTFIGNAAMIFLYGVMVLVFARCNPITFFKKYYPAMLTGFTFASSNAALPTAMDLCGQKLGISKKIYSIALPLGCTVTPGGSCITLAISALFMAKIFEVPVTLSLMTSIAITLLIIESGAPGLPGGALLLFSILLPEIGIPSEAIGIVMGLFSIVGMMLVCGNVTGLGAVTLIVARRENMLNKEIYDG